MMNVLQEIRSGNDTVLEHIYQTQWSPFVKRARQVYACSVEDAQIAFKKALDIFQKNVISKRVHKLDKSLEDYLQMLGDGNLVISLIKNGDERILTKIYKTHRNDFIRYARSSFSCDNETAKDVFQEVMIAFSRNIHRGYLEELTVSLKSYLFDIGKKKLITLKTRNGKRGNIEEQHLFRVEMTTYSSDTTPFQEDVKNHVRTLDGKCQEILGLFYWKRFSMEAIANEMGFKNEQVARNRKSKCLKLLRDKIKFIKK
ncbi:MAG: RNA polymerase sigma factor [Chitinophagales bacterium]